MSQTIKELLNQYQVRKTKKQKSEFIDYAKNKCESLGYSCTIEENKGLVKSRNIVVGDINEAKIVCTAHYDTCAVLPIPNFITPKNFILFFLYQLFLVVVMIGGAFLVQLLFHMLFHNTLIDLLVLEAVLIFIIIYMFTGISNKHTANDNTSGVALLFTMMEDLPKELREKAAFVFFDNEEIGLVGSSAFQKAHKEQMKDKWLINFDCVSDGDHVLFVSSKSVRNDAKYDLLTFSFNKFKDKYPKNTVFTKSSTTLYPSDQIHFKNNIAVAALKKAPIIGLYMDRIHTNRDTKFDIQNINYINNSMIEFISLL